MCHVVTLEKLMWEEGRRPKNMVVWWWVGSVITD